MIYPIAPKFGKRKYIKDIDITISNILQIITLTCLPKPFNMLSITLSRYIKDISGAINFI